MNVKSINDAGQVFPLISTGDGFYEIRKSQTSNVLFGLHQLDPEDPFNEGLEGVFICEEIGAADAILPADYREMRFDSPEAAYDYCMFALAQLSASIKMAA